MNIGNLITRVLLVAVPAFLVVHQSGVQSSAREMPSKEQIVRVSASMFEFTPSEIIVKKGIPVTLELISEDRHHGFKLPEFHLRADINAGVVTKVSFTPQKTGTFAFVCDFFCGDGHEEMSGTLKVVEE